MSAARPPVDAAAWQPWVDHVCRALDVDPAQVDVAAVHELAGEVAAAFTRPMAPVAAHLWGLASGRRGGAADPRAAILAAAREAGR